MSGPNDDPRLTRRQVLGGVAVAGAASLARPATDRAATIPGPRALGVARVGSLAGESTPIAAPRRFTLVGVSWSGPDAARIELRTRARGSAWSRWVLASALGHDPDGRVDRSTLFGEPVWAGSADYVQLRSGRALRGVRLYFVSPAGATAARAHPAMALARPLLDAGPGQPPVIARAVWAQGQAPPAVRAHYGAIKLAFVHHSETANGYGAADVPGILLSIFDYHRYVRGFWDIAYNFAIDAFGRIWEGRAGGIDEPVIGAHAGGYNQASTGVVVLGSFSSVSPSSAAVGALERLLAWKLSLHGVPAHGRATVLVSPSAASFTPFAPGAHVSLPRVAGHRDGDSTDCPGSALLRRAAVDPSQDQRAGRDARAGGIERTGGGGDRGRGACRVRASGTLRRPADGWGAGRSPARRACARADHREHHDRSRWVLEYRHRAECQRHAPRATPPQAGDGVRIGADRGRAGADGGRRLRVSPYGQRDGASIQAEGHDRRARAGERERAAREEQAGRGQGGRFATVVQLPGRGRYALRARTDADAGNAGGSSAVVQALV